MNRELKRIVREAVLDLSSQVALAEAIGVNQATVSKWLSDQQNPDVAACLRLALFTGRSQAEILRLAGYRPEDYLPSTIPPVPAEAGDLESRARILDWERRRKLLPTRLQLAVDRTVDCLLRGFSELEDHELAEAS